MIVNLSFDGCLSPITICANTIFGVYFGLNVSKADKKLSALSVHLPKFSFYATIITQLAAGRMDGLRVQTVPPA
jgi:hypothetical protein